MKLVITQEVKTCTRCNTEYGASEDNFYKLKSKNKTLGVHYRLSPECKKCTIARNKKWQQTVDPEQIREYKRKHDALEYRKENKRAFSKKQRERGDFKKWQIDNKDKIKQYNEKRKFNKTHDISEQEWASCLKFFNNSCAYCGVTAEVSYLIHKQVLHKEHVEHNGKNDISNCVPACRSCNSKKWVKDLDEWYSTDNKIYNESRYQMIISWLSKFDTNNGTNS
ncbi:SPBc2 prophage-derived putative HNH endonuclease YoqL [Rossellomorea marisflavi]|uniref:HNH endonuclease n=1 Tax=Rossellomorea marisflavi TaxID=189381 RepID=UPI0025C8F3B1|nr:HNH endonuclease signature motif containing protein [Rossellomorea marisflavi]GLI82365.1 SPBc2 prophage-derived putative HNH endonuclease YoqL [Rossellomorea marisflavi]